MALVAVLVATTAASCSAPTVAFVSDPYWQATVADTALFGDFVGALDSRGERVHTVISESVLGTEEAIGLVRDIDVSTVYLTPLHSGVARRLAQEFPARRFIGIAAAAAPAASNLAVVRTDRRGAFVHMARVVAAFIASVSDEGSEPARVYALFYTGNATRREERAAFQQEIGVLGIADQIVVRDFNRINAVRDVTTFLREQREQSVDLFLVFLSALSDSAISTIKSMYDAYLIVENSFELGAYGDKLIASVELDWKTALLDAMDTDGVVPVKGYVVRGPASEADRFAVMDGLFLE